MDIVVGGRVNFSYPAGTGEYNVVWDRGSLEPATCVQTAGPVWGYGTTLPWWTQGPGWAGYCTFTAPGTYTYHSGVNPDGFKGTVVVHAEGTPTATPTVTATPTATPTTAPTTAKVSAHDTASPLRNWFQDAASADTSDNTVTIQAGGKVTFDYPAGANYHNVDFRTASKPETLREDDGCRRRCRFRTTTRWRRCRTSRSRPAGWASARSPPPGTYAFVCQTHRRDDRHGHRHGRG